MTDLDASSDGSQEPSATGERAKAWAAVDDPRATRGSSMTDEQAVRAQVMSRLFTSAAPQHPKIGRFVILRRVGEGGMGLVHAAYDEQLDRRVAIKILRRGIDDGSRGRVLREAMAMAKLSHPNVVPVFEIGEHGGRLFIAMEYVEGQTLLDWQREPERAMAELVGAYVQAGRGLAAAHAQGLIHRDFKPQNAMVQTIKGEKLTVRVLDFGLARLTATAPPDEGRAVLARSGLEAETVADDRPSQRTPTEEQRSGPLDVSLTKTGTILGTPAYMSPEQMRGQEADARSDQFSFCVALYEAVYGERPFGGTTLSELMVATEEGIVQPPKGREVPAALRKVLLRGLASEPAQRWPSMDELLEQLQRLIAPRSWRGLAGAGVVLAAIAGVVALQQGVELVQAKFALAAQAEALEEANAGLSEQLATQTGLRAKDIARDEGREIEAVQVAIQAFEGLDPQTSSVPAPVFAGLTHALAGIHRGIALRGHQDQVFSVAVSPDGRRIATASKDSTVCLWDANSGALLRTLEGHERPARAVAWSPGGRRIATAGDDGKARIWDAEAGTELESFPHQGPVRDVGFSPDGRALATANGDAAWVWHGGRDAPVVPLLGHTGPVRSLAWSPDGDQLWTASEDHTVRAWDVQAGTSAQILQGHTEWVLDVAVAPDGTRIATGGRDETVRLWDAATASELGTIEHGDVVCGVAFSPDGSRLATGTFDDGVARLWDVASGRRLDSFRHADAVADVAFSPDGDQLVTVSWDGTARSWNLDQGRALMAIVHPRHVDAVALSLDGTRLAMGSGDGMVRVRDTGSGALLATLHGHRVDVLAVAFSPDGSRIAAASWDGTARVWDPATGTSLHLLKGHTEPVRAVAWSPDGARVATASRDGTARIWDATTGDSLHSVSHGRSIVDVVFAPDGQRLLTLGVGDTARVWNADSGEALPGFLHERRVTALAFSADGKRVAVATHDHEVHVWHVDSREAVATIPGHATAIRSMAFSHDGALLATAGEDGTARVWDIATKSPRATFPHIGPVLDVAWSHDGRHLATASGNEARLWGLDPRDWLTWGCAVLDGRRAHVDATQAVCARVEVPPAEPPLPAAEPLISTAADVSAPETITVHGVELVLIPAGRFTMGSPPTERGRRDREGPPHEVMLDSFYLARTELTNAQYALYVEANPDVTEPPGFRDYRINRPNQPVVGVTWYDAKAYCDWAGLMLPTEAQWEYAARAGTKTAYWFGNDTEDLERFDWYLDVTSWSFDRRRTHSVATKGPNPFGLYDMHGNVAEWMLDAYGPYTKSPRPGDGLRHEPIGVAKRVLRGGQYPPLLVRAASRHFIQPESRGSVFGFRPASRVQ